MLTDFMEAMSFIGSGGVYLSLLVLVYWCVDPRWGARAAVLLTISTVLNTVLKLFFHEPRPFWTDTSITGHEPRDSFGMPSGHAQSAAVFWGFAAARAPAGRPALRRAAWAVALVMIGLIGASRVVLGVHSIGQVAAGYAIGAVLLAVGLHLEPLVVPWWTRRPLAAQLGLALGVSLVLAGFGWAAVEALDGWHWPASWAHAIAAAGGRVEPITVGDSAAAAGGLFGLLAGLSWMAYRGGYDASGQVWRRLARVPVGAVGVSAFYTLGLFLGTQPVQAFAGHALLALWATAGAPEAFMRLGLAPRTTRAVTRAGEERAEVRQ
ncbi:phosphatase PAP2 family protein [Actinomadura sp. NPDC047616]|uniref:phosphatase PAP2 family protein n=1 Tax=Actinomadura sp. NPDC047616 TaxID=3155914 RepID=UPI0033D06A6D